MKNFWMILLFLTVRVLFAGEKNATRPFYQFSLVMRGMAFDNADFTPLDNTSYQTVEESDDRIFLVDTSLRLHLKALLFPFATVEAAVSYTGYWGNDSLAYGNSDRALNLNRAFLRVNLNRFRSDDEKIELSIGRQYYSLFPAFFFPEYVWNDTIDAIVLRLNRPSGWGLEAVVDLYSMNSPADGIYTLNEQRHDAVMPHFDGDVNIIRYALSPFFKSSDWTGKKGRLFKVFAVYARIGATLSGSDFGGAEISQNGYAGNSPDGDWLFNTGCGIESMGERWRGKVMATLSFGEDRHENGQTAHNGFFIQAVIRRLLGKGSVGAELLWMGKTGSGTHPNKGFAGMKGNRVGGLLSRFYLGRFPSGILSYRGLETSDTARPLNALVLDWRSRSRFTDGGKGGARGWAAKILLQVLCDSEALSRDPGQSMLEGTLKITYVVIPGAFECALEEGILTPSLNVIAEGDTVPATGVILSTRIDF